jgi:hypothetical protein
LHVEIRVHGSFEKPPPARLLHPDNLLEATLIGAVRDAVGTLVANREADKHLREPGEFVTLNKAIREVVQTTLKRDFAFVCKNDDDIALIYSDEDLQALTRAILGQEPIRLEEILIGPDTTSQYDHVPITVVYDTSAVKPEVLVSMLAKGYKADTFREHFTDFLKRETVVILQRLPPGTLVPTQSDETRENLQNVLSHRSEQAFGAAVQITSLQVFPTERAKLMGRHADLPLKKIQAQIEAEEAILAHVAQAHPMSIEAMLSQLRHLEAEREAILADRSRIRDLEHIDAQIKLLLNQVVVDRQPPNPPGTASGDASSDAKHPGDSQVRGPAPPEKSKLQPSRPTSVGDDA